MPPHAPTSFASAAAGNAGTDGSQTAASRSSNRGDASGSGDWTRPRINGAGTTTFRRPSLATSIPQSSQHHASNHQGSTSQSNASRHAVDYRFSKDQLLSMYKNQKDSGDLSRNLAALFVGGWEPGKSTNSGPLPWNKRDEQTKDVAAGPDVCWDTNGDILPLGLFEMDESERQHFSTSVNSPLKPPPQTGGKEQGQASALGGRKTSISHAQGVNHVISSPSSARPSNRRRDTTESTPHSANPLSSPPSGGRNLRDDPPAQTPPSLLLRRRTDLRDAPSAGSPLDQDDRSSSAHDGGPMPGLQRRTTTGPLSATGNTPISPWSGGGSLTPMGSFGNFGVAETSGQNTPSEKKPGFGSARGGSRWSKFMSKDGQDEGTPEKSAGNPSGSTNGQNGDQSSQSWRSARIGRPMSNDTDPFGDDAPQQSGSAALGGSQERDLDQSRSALGLPKLEGHSSRDDFGFTDLGMPSNAAALRDSAPDSRHQSGLYDRPRSGTVGREPLSPTHTNPYQSPGNEKADSEDIDTDDSELQSMHHPGLSGIAGDQKLNSIGNIIRGGPAIADGSGGGDRSQSSSIGPSRGFSGLGGLGSLGGLGGWPPAAVTSATPSQDKPAFSAGLANSSAFNPLGDLHSPGFAGFGNSLFGAGSGPPQSLSGGLPSSKPSKLGSLFPSGMQAQMFGGELPKQSHSPAHGEHKDPGLQDHGFDSLSRALPDATGSAFTAARRDTDSPLRSNAAYDDAYLQSLEGNRSIRSENQFPGADVHAGAFAGTHQSASLTTPVSGVLNKASQQSLQSQPSQQSLQQVGPQLAQAGAPATSQPGPPQPRTMVMPDRMRWIYRDPQGSTQGPWSGLEMHDWFKAGFFSAELLVKKVEDPDFEPLGQLIRRIGNSREPFLVPQNGVAYGPTSTPSSAQWTPTSIPPSGNPASQGGSVQPPFAGAFPSFGTTLTAEQQNALERRKQEEQFLMARQKEYLTQHQLHKQIHQMPGAVHPQQLHHHSSAHSLHSQPSFGSVTSPVNYHPTPPQGPLQPSQPVPGFFDSQPRPGNAASGLGASGDLTGVVGSRDDELAALLARQHLARDNTSQFGNPAAFNQPQHHQPELSLHQQHLAGVHLQRLQLQREQAQQGQLQPPGLDEQTSMERLQQFNDLRGRQDDHPYPRAPELDMQSAGSAAPREAFGGQRAFDEQQHTHRTEQNLGTFSSKPPETSESSMTGSEVLSLTQQVQRAASEQQSPAPTSKQDQWSRSDNVGLPPSFPPPQSISPLPAPAAQRNRQNLSETLDVDSPSTTQTPSLETSAAAASIAPWAKETNEGSKGPSLKEIQEAEALKASRAGEIAVATRRAALEQERVSQPAAPLPAPGLPSSASWANGSSPVTPTGSAPTAWAKSAAGKSNAAQKSSGAKTLSQIQKEEEARKQKAAASTASSGTLATGPSGPGGKRYADLAGKAAQAQPGSANGAWTTVGASGKVKGPASPAAAPAPQTVRAASGSAPATSTSSKGRPSAGASRGSTGNNVNGTRTNAHDEFTKWAKSALAKGLNTNINVDDFVQQLLMFPPEAEIISESVDGNSQTMDGRRFAEEFLRRRKLADKGIVDSSTTASSGFTPSSGSDPAKNGGGWSEVAKKGPVAAKDHDANSTFKVVAAKKKGRK
ncbi:MAG: hypothetical protein M1825_000916 [Sarcosagium campestre]|nr:MAG: hypothetical protein M1825_000916 [Sarcosagium campestre]